MVLRSEGGPAAENRPRAAAEHRPTQVGLAPLHPDADQRSIANLPSRCAGTSKNFGLQLAFFRARQGTPSPLIRSSIGQECDSIDEGSAHGTTRHQTTAARHE